MRAHRCSFRRHDECGGTVAALAAAISTPALPVRANTISMWRLRRNVPSEYCPAIERETRRRGRPVPCERFQPRIDWESLREQSATADSEE